MNTANQDNKLIKVILRLLGFLTIMVMISLALLMAHTDYSIGQMGKAFNEMLAVFTETEQQRSTAIKPERQEIKKLRQEVEARSETQDEYQSAKLDAFEAWYTPPDNCDSYQSSMECAKHYKQAKEAFEDLVKKGEIVITNQ